VWQSEFDFIALDMIRKLKHSNSVFNEVCLKFTVSTSANFVTWLNEIRHFQLYFVNFEGNFTSKLTFENDEVQLKNTNEVRRSWNHDI
jgi:hypothetical protein